jgi:hypothetical protein
MHEGNWKLGVLMDESASDDQAEKLGQVFSGQIGGPMEALGPLVSEQLGVERVPMEFSSENGHHKLTLGDKGSVEVDDVVPFGSESGEPAKLTDVFHPAGTTLTVAKATDASGVQAFGLDLGNGGKSGFSGPFAWSG